MTGPAYVASVGGDTYEPHCQATSGDHGRKMWRGERTTDLTAAHTEAQAHSESEHRP